MNKLLAVGDSHCRELFGYIKEHKLLPNIDLKFLGISSASAYGLNNPNSKTQSNIKIKDFIENNPDSNLILIWLGNVDTDFIIWYKYLLDKSDIDEIINKSINRFYKYINSLNIKKDKICIICPQIPVIDDKNIEEVLNINCENVLKDLDIKEKKGKLKQISQVFRTKTTLTYNSRLKEKLKEKGLRFIDINNKIIDKNNEIVSKKYLRNNKKDHHLEPRKIARICVEEITKILQKD